MKQENYYKLKNGVVLLPGSKAMITVATTKNLFKEEASVVKLPAQGTKEYRGVAPWGANNNFPSDLVDRISINPVAMRALEHKIDISFGQGVKIGYRDDNDKFIAYTNEEKRNNSNIKDAVDFLKNNNIDEYASELFADINWFSNGFVEIILNKELTKINSLSAVEATFSRLETANEYGIIENHFYSTKWGSAPKAEEYEATPVLFAKNKTKELKINMGKLPADNGKPATKKYTSYIIPIRMPSPGRVYYSKPYFNSVIESGWMDLADAIPQFKIAMMNNSMTLKYQIELDEGYFSRIFINERVKTDEEKDARIKKEYEDLDSFLKGSDNAGKSIITFKRHDSNGKVISSLDIKIIEHKVGGEYIQETHESSAMIFLAFGVHASLLGEIPGGTTSNLSGSDKRDLFNISGAMQQRIRSIVLSPLYLVKDINGWDEDIEFAIPNVILNTLDQTNEVETIVN